MKDEGHVMCLGLCYRHQSDRKVRAGKSGTAGRDGVQKRLDESVKESAAAFPVYSGSCWNAVAHTYLSGRPYGRQPGSHIIALRLRVSLASYTHFISLSFSSVSVLEAGMGLLLTMSACLIKGCICRLGELVSVPSQAHSGSGNGARRNGIFS